MNFMIDVTYFRTLRYDSSVEFTGPARLTASLTRSPFLPGVLRTEPHRTVSVILRNENRSRRLGLTGIKSGNRLRGLLDPEAPPPDAAR